MASDKLERIWTEHLDAEFAAKDVEATLATMINDAYVNHVPVGTGGRGKEELRRFYRDVFIPSWPDDVEMQPFNRVLGESQLVDELHATLPTRIGWTGSCQLSTPPSARSKLTLSWWSSSKKTRSPASASTGTTQKSSVTSGSSLTAAEARQAFTSAYTQTAQMEGTVRNIGLDVTEDVGRKEQIDASLWELSDGRRPHELGRLAYAVVER